METSESAPQAFLNGGGIPVPLGEVEAELLRLWGPSAERAGGPDLANPAITRVSLANLVVVRLGDDNPEIDRALDTVVSRHPSRVIELRLQPDDQRKVKATVSAHCTLPAPGLPQVCCERIVLSAGEQGVALMPGAVRPLLEADLPLVVWWVGESRKHAELFRELAAEATRLIPDLPDPESDLEAVSDALLPERCGCAHSRDLAWFGLTRWRELVAGLFDPPGAGELLDRLHTVEVTVNARRAEKPSRVGAWVIGWLAGQLGWKPVEKQMIGNRLEARFEGPKGPVRALLESHARPEEALATVSSVALHARPTADGDDDRFKLVRIEGTEHVRIETCSRHRCSLGRVVHAADSDTARRVSAALESSREDPPYHAALPVLLWLIG